jgi:hypothetical protein
MYYSESEEAWLELRAKKIAEETDCPLPVARSEAMAQLVRNRAMPKASVTELPFKGENRARPA